MTERPRGPWDFDEPPPPAVRPPRVRAWLWLALAVSLGALIWALFRAFPEAVQKPGDWSNLAWAVAMLVLLMTGAVYRFGRGAIGQHLRHAALWSGLVALLALGYAYRDVLMEAPQRLQLAFSGSGAPIATAEHEVVVPQDDRGAFVLNARVNGQAVGFIVDTGATDTVLSPQAAERLGVDLGKLAFRESAETANGMGYGAAYVAQKLEVGPIVLNDFPMEINKAPMTRSLLGLSFLNRLDSFEIRDRKLILKWRDPQAAPAAATAAPQAAATPAPAAPAAPAGKK